MRAGTDCGDRAYTRRLGELPSKQQSTYRNRRQQQQVDITMQAEQPGAMDNLKLVP